MNRKIGIRCCESIHMSNFCPNCGKKLDVDTDLYDLWLHCEKHAELQIKMMTSAHNGTRQYASHLAAAKWRIWADKLATVLETQIELIKA